MEPVLSEAPLSAAEELAAVLDFSGVTYERQDMRFRFLFTSQGCKWQVVCDGIEDRVMVFSIHPTPVRDRPAALETCSRINSQVLSGSCFVQDERIIFRTQAELIEACAAREMILRALEYNAAVMTSFWSAMARGAEGIRPELFK